MTAESDGPPDPSSHPGPVEASPGGLGVWPAVDLLGGRAVRLRRGRFDAVDVVGEPVELARRFAAAAPAGLHLVDLDGARRGRPAQLALVAEMVAAARDGAAPGRVELELGGGLRHPDDIAAAIDTGVDRVVLGTAVLAEPTVAAELVAAWPGRVAVALDHLGPPGYELAGEAWTASAGVGLLEVAARLEAAGAAALEVTAIARDGMLGGPDLAGIEAVLGATKEVAVVASGGVASSRDLRALARVRVEGRRLAGVIVGRALYSGDLDLEEAVRVCRACG